MCKVSIENICSTNTVPFSASDSEIIAYALDDLGLIDEDTLVDGHSAREMAKKFYEKRDRFRENTRLGQLLVNEYGVTKEQLVEALRYHELNGDPLGVSFIKLNICSREQINEALSKQITMRKLLSR